jgi:Zn-dependent alcohol dehydrogenase
MVTNAALHGNVPVRTPGILGHEPAGIIEASAPLRIAQAGVIG